MINDRLSRPSVQGRVHAAIEYLKSVHPQWVASKALCDAINCPYGSSTDLKNGLIASGAVAIEERPERHKLWFRYVPEGESATLELSAKPIDESAQLRAIKAEVFKVAEPLAKKYPCDLLKQVFAQTFDYLA